MVAPARATVGMFDKIGSDVQGPLIDLDAMDECLCTAKKL